MVAEQMYVADIFLTDARNVDVSSACLIQPIACALRQTWTRHWYNTLCLLSKLHLIGSYDCQSTLPRGCSF